MERKQKKPPLSLTCWIDTTCLFFPPPWPCLVTCKPAKHCTSTAIACPGPLFLFCHLRYLSHSHLSQLTHTLHAAHLHSHATTLFCQERSQEGRRESSSKAVSLWCRSREEKKGEGRKSRGGEHREVE